MGVAVVNIFPECVAIAVVSDLGGQGVTPSTSNTSGAAAGKVMADRKQLNKEYNNTYCSSQGQYFF